jgi:SHS2 domain-containing protein
VVELHCSDTALSASLAARPIDRIQRQVKAVTYHNLAIKTTPEGVSVIVVFDA